MSFLHRDPHNVFGLSAAARFFHEEPDDAGGATSDDSSTATDTLSEFEPTDGKPVTQQPPDRVEVASSGGCS